MKFDKVEIEHITLAIEDFIAKGIPEGFGTSNYFDVEIEGELYPPKPIIAYANQHATGEEPKNDFSGGRRTPCFRAFERLGVKILPISNPKDLPKFIELYKKLISNQLPEANYNELYKWETFQHFKDNWDDSHSKDTIVQNFELAFNQENNNLWSGSHYLPLKMLKQFAVDRPDTVSQMMHQLFDEEQPINERLLTFESGSEELLNELRPNEDISHYQSRRAMMLYLSLKYPDKYFLYKNGMFNDFAKISKFWPPFGTAKKKDYTVIDEFRQMCREVKEVLLQDEELLELHQKRIPEGININDDYNLLTQDFIYAVATYLNPSKQKNTEPINFILANITWNSKDWKEVSEDSSVHAWVGGENIPHESWNFDLSNPRNKDGKILGFAKFTHPPKVEGNNNLIIFYSKGQIVGFYGKAEVLKEIVDVNDRESYNLIGEQGLCTVLPTKIENIKEKGYLEGKERVGQVGFGYIQNTSTVLELLEEAAELNVEQSEVINRIKDWVEFAPDMTEDEERLVNILKQVGYDDSDGLYSVIEQVLSSLNIEFGDKRVCYSLPKNKLVGLTIGQKYAAVIEIKRGKNTYRYFDTIDGDKNWLKSTNTIQEMADKLNVILDSAKSELEKTDKTGYTRHSSEALETSLFDKSYKQYIFQKAFNKNFKEEDMSSELNQIFFGPPGTGKTYHTINEAIKIVDPEFYEEFKEDRDKLKERFKLLLLKDDNEDIGQIGFTTFHQSFSYEDFIEGIKPVEPAEDDTYLKYQIQDGIFKRICRIAKDSLNAVTVDSDSLISLSADEFDKAHFYKMSLGNTQSEEDNEIYDYCVENNCITIGFGDSLDFTNKDEKELRSFGQEKGLKPFAIQAMNLFCNYLKTGNYVVVSYGNHYVRAIGKVVGDYEYVEESPFPNNTSFNHFRKVEWFFTNKEIAAKEIYNKNLQQQTIYKLEKKEIKQDFFVKKKKVDALKLPKNPKNYVLIVDEINRGNVSSIFGELITLIEKDKRAGTSEELSAILPYSKKEFKVPQNVYIIGTMNTADRSIEALDTALRRRFSFREMAPQHDLISTEGELKPSSGKLGDIDVVKVLGTINNRVEKLIDKDHKIGHSYFLGISDKNDLRKTFKDKVIPLLEEYFFGDFGKISLVLGSSFITKTTKSDVTFAKDNEYDPSIASDLLERSVYVVTPMDQWDFKAIYE